MVIGALVVVGAIIGGVVLLGGGSGGGGKVTDDGKIYKLTTPDTVLGDYRSSFHDVGSNRPLTSEQAQAFAMANGKGISTQWATVGEVKKIRLLGAYGEVKDPEKSVDAYFSFLRAKSQTSGSNDSDVELVGTPERKSPEGLDNAVMKCQVIRPQEKPTDPKEPTQLSLCVWGDYDTVGAVAPSEEAKTVTLDQSAKAASDLRKEIRAEVT
jgi:hypothetical protein